MKQRRSSERIKQSVSNLNEEDQWSSDENEKDTENVLKMTKRQKQIRLISKPTSTTATTGTSTTSTGPLQIKLKIPQTTQTAAPIKKQVDIKLPKDMDPEPVCPICLKIIIGDYDEINEHIDECIGPSSNFTLTPIDSGICTPEEVPRASMLSLINVDEDDFGYGKSQYSETDVEKIIKADLNASKKKPSQEAVEAEKQETKNSLLIQGILSAASPNSDFLSLQTALKSLLDRLATTPKCAVCWETLKMPAVASVNCWHVCCEDCWLRTLGTKRLCPHCSTITNPSDLRKVFF